MKKYMFACSLMILLALFSLSGSLRADSADDRALVLSNEIGSKGASGLIDQLIAAGHGSKNLYQILQFLTAQSGSGIPADFVTAVGSNPAGSEVFTATLSNFAGLNNPVCINADGTLSIVPIFGRDLDGDTGFVTNKVHYPGIALANFTMATSPAYYVHAGEKDGGPPTVYYQAIGIAYANHSRSFVISNEAPGYLIDKLIAAGYQNLYQVLQFLAAKSGSGIPADFVTEVGNSPADSEVFTAALNNFAGLNNPVGINADGTLMITGVYGLDYDGKTGYVTNNVDYTGIGKTRITMATSPVYYIVPQTGYYAIGIAWAEDTTPPAAPTGLTVD